MNDSILILEPCVKNYDWGNDYFIADLLEQEKNGPRAEMWIGAHRLGSAVVKSSGEKLCDFLDSNPGFASCDADSFPYLLKILAIAQSLSIQCHPDAKQAREGFEAEKPKHERIDRKDWNYQDLPTEASSTVIVSFASRPSPSRALISRLTDPSSPKTTNP